MERGGSRAPPQAQEALAASDAVRLERVEALERRVLNRIAHEFATPLTPLLLELHLLRSGILGPLPEAQRRALDVADRCAQRLALLLSHALDVRGNQMPAVALLRRPVDLNELAHRAASAFRPAAEEAGLRLELEPAPRALVVDADAELLLEVVHRALRQGMLAATPGGGLAMGLRALPDEAVLELRVLAPTSGPARGPVDGDPWASLGGAGLLGLTLGITVVELHGGSLDHHAGTDGSSLLLRLPLRPSTSGGLPEAARAPS